MSMFLKSFGLIGVYVLGLRKIFNKDGLKIMETWAGNVAQLVQHRASMHEVLGSVLSTAK